MNVTLPLLGVVLAALLISVGLRGCQEQQRTDHGVTILQSGAAQ